MNLCDPIIGKLYKQAGGPGGPGAGPGGETYDEPDDTGL